MPLPVPEDKYEEKAIADIGSHGVHVIHVLEDDNNTRFTYSVGLFHSYQHPEIIILGLSQEVAHSIINNLASDLEAKKVFLEADNFYNDFIEGFPITVRKVPTKKYDGYVNWAIWLYGGLNFPLFQLIYPTVSGGWPWDSDASDDFKSLQPMLTDSH